MLFQTHKAALKPQTMIASAYDAMFLTSAVVGFGSAVLFAGSLDKISKAFLTTMGLTGLTFYTVNVKLNEKPRKFAKAMEQAQLDSMKYTLDEEEEIERLKAEMQGATRKVEQILDKSQPWEWGYWADRAKVVPNMPPIQELTGEQVEQPTIQTTASPIGVNNQSSFDDLQSVSSDLDYSWLDDDFVKASKAVFGARGSGKTTYLNYEALRFLQAYPDGELRIADLHFDPDEPKWLPGVASDVLLKSFVANKKDKIIALISYCNKELKDRIDKMDKKRKRIKLIIDEFVGLLGRCDDKEIKLIDSFLATSQDEGRKFGVDVTLGLHSLKKERCKIDSSVLWQMDILCLANSIADPATKFPSDWENKQLAQDRHTLQAELKKGEGFACVVCKNHAGEPARVEVLPHIDLSQFEINVACVNSPVDSFTADHNLPGINSIHDQMVTWMQSLEVMPTAKQVRDKWEALTGQEMSIKALKGMLIALGLEKP
jgi:hypothetical protein